MLLDTLEKKFLANFTSLIPTLLNYAYSSKTFQTLQQNFRSFSESFRIFNIFLKFIFRKLTRRLFRLLFSFFSSLPLYTLIVFGLVGMAPSWISARWWGLWPGNSLILPTSARVFFWSVYVNVNIFGCNCYMLVFWCEIACHFLL